MLTYADFKSLTPARSICDRLGLPLDRAVSWDHLTSYARAQDDFPGRAKKLYGVASSGERALIAAIMTAVDYAAQADKLSQGRAWQRTEHCSGDHRRAMAAAVAREG